MAAYVKYDKGVEVLQEAGNAGSDSWRLILSNTAPDVVNDTDATSADELATAGGYTAGGIALTILSAAQSGGVFKLVLETPADPAWTASGPGFTFRYVILYNLTRTQCIGYWDAGSSIVMDGSRGDTFTPVLSEVNGVYTVI